MPTSIEELPGAQASLEGLIGGGRPRVLRGLCRDWPMVAWARESDTRFAQQLAALDNGTPVSALVLAADSDGVVGYNAALDGFNYEYFKVSVTQVLQRLAAYSTREGARGVALQSALIDECLPRLLDTHRLPLLDAAIRPRLWMGNRVTTPAHFDSDHNIAVVVCGRRRFTLFAPEQVSNLYIGPLDFAPTVAAIGIPRLQADDAQHPRLATALEQAWIAELEPGDAIYIPPVWWHHVESLEQLNALVNYWFRPDLRPGYRGAPGLPALYHCLLAFKHLPPAERAAWKAILEHYVFDAEDPALHIPPARRGVLGPPTPETVAWLRQRGKPEG